MYLSGMTPQGYCSSPGDDPTTLIAGGQDAHDVGHRVGQPGVAHGAVDDALGLGGEQGVEVVDGFDARHRPAVQADAAQLSGVVAHLLRRGDTHTGQLELRVGDEFG